MLTAGDVILLGPSAESIDRVGKPRLSGAASPPYSSGLRFRTPANSRAP